MYRNLSKIDDISGGRASAYFIHIKLLLQYPSIRHWQLTFHSSTTIGNDLFQPLWASGVHSYWAVMATVARWRPPVNGHLLVYLILACLLTIISGQLPCRSSSRRCDHQQDADKNCNCLHAFTRCLHVEETKIEKMMWKILQVTQTKKMQHPYRKDGLRCVFLIFLQSASSRICFYATELWYL